MCTNTVERADGGSEQSPEDLRFFRRLLWPTCSSSGVRHGWVRWKEEKLELVELLRDDNNELPAPRDLRYVNDSTESERL